MHSNHEYKLLINVPRYVNDKQKYNVKFVFSVFSCRINYRLHNSFLFGYEFGGHLRSFTLQLKRKLEVYNIRNSHTM